MEEIPLSSGLLFGSTLIICLGWIGFASRSWTFLAFLVLWTLFQSYLAHTGWYQNTQNFPPKIMLFGVLPNFVWIGILFLSKAGQRFLDTFRIKALTAFHSIRVPVEIVLLLLFYQRLISIHMTFEGTNFDIFSGITAPFVAYFAFRNGTISSRLLLGWNVLCLILLLNVVVTAVFSIPGPLQQLAFEQPNIAILYFPFSLLPTVIVPLVLFAHLVAIRSLIKKHN